MKERKIQKVNTQFNYLTIIAKTVPNQNIRTSGRQVVGKVPDNSSGTIQNRYI
jgi:hypothetical protein